MARARNIKPGLFKNEVLGVADPLLTILFEGLWVLADRDGKLEDRPMRIKAEIFPYREGLSVDEMLNWLQANGFIRRYAAKGQKCIAVLEFVKHQNPHKNEAPSELPDAEPDQIGTTSEKIGSARADSLSSDSGSLIPETGSPSVHSAAAPAAPEPEKPKKAKRPAVAVPQPDDVSERVWADWLALRAKKRAPVTETVLDEARKEAAIAQLTLERFLAVWCARGSQGLEASWLSPKERGRGPPGDVNRQEAIEARNRAVGEEWLAQQGGPG